MPIKELYFSHHKDLLIHEVVTTESSLWTSCFLADNYNHIPYGKVAQSKRFVYIIDSGHAGSCSRRLQARAEECGLRRIERQPPRGKALPLKVRVCLRGNQVHMLNRSISLAAMATQCVVEWNMFSHVVLHHAVVISVCAADRMALGLRDLAVWLEVPLPVFLCVLYYSCRGEWGGDCAF